MRFTSTIPIACSAKLITGSIVVVTTTKSLFVLNSKALGKDFVEEISADCDSAECG